MRVGRPTKYKSKYCEMLVQHMSNGLSLRAFASDIEVSHECLYEWARRYQDFSDAIKRGRDKQAKYYEVLGLAIMTGQKDLRDANVTAFIWMTKNMLGWSDKTTIKTPEDEPLDLRVSAAENERLKAIFREVENEV